MFILNSQMFTARKICQIRNHFDFKHSIFFVFSFFRSIPPARPMYIHNLLKPSGFFTQEALKLKRAPDLDRFSTYSLFGPLCCVSFFTFCLHSGRLCLVRDYKIAGSKQYKGNELKTKLTLKLKHFSLKLSVRRSFS